MSRPARIDPLIAALDGEIADARLRLDAAVHEVEQQRAIVGHLLSARARLVPPQHLSKPAPGAAALPEPSSDLLSDAAPSEGQVAGARQPPGSLDKLIVEKLGTGAKTAEQLRLATSAKPASLRSALARMVAAAAITLADDRYALPVRDAAA